jgi:signal transduction histidine kinase
MRTARGSLGYVSRRFVGLCCVDQSGKPAIADFLSGGGELGELLRGYDWTKTPLGAPVTWPQSLRMAIRIMLTSRQPIWIGWGKELTYFYNDPYKSIIGGKHPWALGKPTIEVWREIWDDIGPMLATAMGGEQGTYVESQLLIMERNGYPEETYYTFSYSPIPDDDGTVGGIFCANSDDTARVISERQIGLLQELAAKTANTRSWQEACEQSARALATNPRDLPFALLYVTDPMAPGLSLVGTSGIERTHVAAPATIDATEDSRWPIAEALRTHEAQLVDNLAALFDAPLPKGAWQRPPSQAFVLPFSSTGEATRSGVLIAGLNPYRLFDENYRGFLGLTAGQIAAALANAEAYEAEKRRSEALAELDRAKTTFFSNVSHEFRTPLTLMLGPVEALLTDAPDPDSRNKLELVHRNGMRMLRLVNSLLDFSRIEAGRLQASFEPTDLGKLTADIAAAFRSIVEGAGLSFTIDCHELPSQIFVDRESWEKIVFNLLSNAFKFTHDGGITVGIQPSADSREAVLRVSDTGIGIAAEDQPRLFERFHRIEGAQGRSFEGTGIGLALVQELVRIHGGTVQVESIVGRGTSLIVRIPFGSGHLPADQLRARTTSTAGISQGFLEEALRWLPTDTKPQSLLDTAIELSPSAAPSNGQRILLADDNADMRDYVRQLLETRGYQVEAVGDGETALTTARATRPDLILTDVMMPRLNGIELLRMIRSDPILAGTPVVMLSARAGEDARVEALDAIADDYLAKPFAARELLARIKSNIEIAALRRRAEVELQTINAELERRVEAEVAERLQVEQALRQAQKMESIGQLTGGVAHDFNNLLTVIIGGLDTIRRAKPEDQARIKRGVDMAFHGAQRAASLTSRLLAFSRRQPLSPRPLDLNVLVRDLSELLHRTLGETIELEIVGSPRLWTVEVDQNQLESAIINLAVNARDAMPRGGRLTIETSNTMLDESYAAHDVEVQPGQYVMLAVSDNGEGMSKETLAHAFEPFYTTKEVGKGTGLGLSMVYGFVKQSRGHVTLYSELGHGTSVKLYFPRYDGEPRTIAGEQIVAPLSASRDEVVLVVEDNNEVRAYSVDILKELGYKVLEAGHAEAAVRLLETTERVDLLFTDVILPGDNGRTLADRALQLRPDLHVLFTTGYSRNAIVHHGRLDSHLHLISKPFTFNQLATKLRELLD